MSRATLLAWSDLTVPLAVREPTRWLLADHAAPEQIAPMFGVMAVAAGRFQGPGDGYTRHTVGLGAMEFANRLSGPHSFEVPAAVAPLLAAPGFRAQVAQAAYRQAQNRTDAGRLADAIESGEQWPLPNVVISELEVAHG